MPSITTRRTGPFGACFACGRNIGRAPYPIDRTDRSANLREMKFSEAELVIDKAYARELAHKRDTFRAITKTRKALFTTLVTTYGVRANEHAMNLGVQTVLTDALYT